MEKNKKMFIWGLIVLVLFFILFLLAVTPFLSHAYAGTPTFKWTKLGGAPMIKGGVRNQDDLINKLGDPGIQEDFVRALEQAYPEYDAEELFVVFQMAVECSDVTQSSYQPGAIFPDGMFFKPRKGVFYDSRPVEWLGKQTLEALEVKFPYNEEEFWITIIKKCGNGIPRKNEVVSETQPLQPQAFQPPAVRPAPPPQTQIVEKEVLVEVPVEVPVEVTVQVPPGQRSWWGSIPLPPPIIINGGYYEYRSYSKYRNYGYSRSYSYNHSQPRSQYRHKTSRYPSKSYPTKRPNYRWSVPR
ncbi:MAG: hypothetical protein A2Y98_00510 [Candidatus Portnoybacteria bacterium RBG_19FT_COMBO_36_7]|uniref:Uncharacterized protein n=1 Tax=Candidatus Portnoybacteria bacterium RBG_19FT_COMBO_36_7 TaxID=1801992 RepID=A0A1G2F849_9BACT|nr:MAG: hypothetical protein A2Y98_00510 [Candidatus Portnoybacteria bacterium RBG_19FT_COMBO_36_7]